jgi:hypothetical protein
MGRGACCAFEPQRLRAGFTPVLASLRFRPYRHIHDTGYSLFQFGAFVDYGFFHVPGPDCTINEQPKNMVYPHYDAANKILTVSRMP